MIRLPLQRLAFQVIAFSLAAGLMIGVVASTAHSDELPVEYFPSKLITEGGESQHVNIQYDPSYPDLVVESMPFEFDIMAEEVGNNLWADDLVDTVFDPASDDKIYVRFDASLLKLNLAGQTQWKLELTREKDNTTALYLSPRGTIAYLGMLTNEIHVIDPATGHITQTFPDVCQSGCMAISLSPDEQFLAVGDGSGRISLLQPSTGIVLSTWQAHDYPIRFVRLLQEPQGNFLLSYDWFDLAVRNLDDQAELRRFSDITLHDRKNIWIETLDLIAGNSLAVIGSGLHAKVIDFRNGDVRREFGPTLNTSLLLHVTEDETALVGFSRDHLLYRWDLDTQVLLGRGYARTPLFSVFVAGSISRDGKRFALASMDPVIAWPPKNFQHVRIYKTAGN